MKRVRVPLSIRVFYPPQSLYADEHSLVITTSVVESTNSRASTKPTSLSSSLHHSHYETQQPNLSGGPSRSSIQQLVHRQALRQQHTMHKLVRWRSIPTHHHRQRDRLWLQSHRVSHGSLRRRTLQSQQQNRAYVQGYKMPILPYRELRCIGGRYQGLRKDLQGLANCGDL